MLAVLKQLVQSIIVILMLSAFLQIILPSGGMRRYAQLAVGLLMVLTLLAPLLDLVRTPFIPGELLGQAAVEAAWEELQVGSEILQHQNNTILLANYRQALTEHIRELVESSGDVRLLSCELALVEDSRARDFGRVTAMTVELDCRLGAVQPVASVRPVQVGENTSETPAQPTPEAVERAAAIHKTLANHYALAAENVVVRIK